MWSYSGNPGASARDAVRFLIGDTDQTDQILQNGEITYLLSQYGNNVLNASIRAIEGIMAKFARMSDESVGPVRISFSQRLKGYERMRQTLIQRQAMTDASPYAGGISQSDASTVDADGDRTKPDFTKHMMENENISPWVSELNSHSDD